MPVVAEDWRVTGNLSGGLVDAEVARCAPGLARRREVSGGAEGIARERLEPLDHIGVAQIVRFAAELDVAEDDRHGDAVSVGADVAVAPDAAAKDQSERRRGGVVRRVDDGRLRRRLCPLGLGTAARAL